MSRWWGEWGPGVVCLSFLGMLFSGLILVAWDARHLLVAQAIDRGQELALRRLMMQQEIDREVCKIRQAQGCPCQAERWTW